MPDIDGILSRFQARSEESRDKPRQFEEPAPPTRVGRRGPTDEESIRILSAAIKVGRQLAERYKPDSKEFACLTVLTRFAEDMLP